MFTIMDAPTHEILECLQENGFVHDHEWDWYVKQILPDYSLIFISTGCLHCFSKKTKHDTCRVVVLSKFSTKKDWNEIVSRVADLENDLSEVLT